MNLDIKKQRVQSVFIVGALLTLVFFVHFKSIESRLNVFIVSPSVEY